MGHVSQQRRTHRYVLLVTASPLLSAWSSSAFVQPRFRGSSGKTSRPFVDPNRVSFDILSGRTTRLDKTSAGCRRVHEGGRSSSSSSSSSLGAPSLQCSLLLSFPPQQRSASGMTALHARKKRKHAVSDPLSWYDEDDQPRQQRGLDNSSGNDVSPSDETRSGDATPTAPILIGRTESISPPPSLPLVSGTPAALEEEEGDEWNVLDDGDVLPALVEAYGLDQDVAGTFGRADFDLADYPAAVPVMGGDSGIDRDRTKRRFALIFKRVGWRSWERYLEMWPLCQN